MVPFHLALRSEQVGDAGSLRVDDSTVPGIKADLSETHADDVQTSFINTKQKAFLKWGLGRGGGGGQKVNCRG